MLMYIRNVKMKKYDFYVNGLLHSDDVTAETIFDLVQDLQWQDEIVICDTGQPINNPVLILGKMTV